MTCVLLAVAGSGCHSRPGEATASHPPPAIAGILAPSPRLIVGRILSVDATRGFAMVELATDAPPDALAPDTELQVRTTDLRPTGIIRASRHQRARILGTTIVAGQPAPGDEVVWLAP